MQNIVGSRRVLDDLYASDKFTVIPQNSPLYDHKDIVLNSQIKSWICKESYKIKYFSSPRKYSVDYASPQNV